MLYILSILSVNSLDGWQQSEDDYITYVTYKLIIRAQVKKNLYANIRMNMKTLIGIGNPQIRSAEISTSSDNNQWLPL
jgi:hypothetical protein